MNTVAVAPEGAAEFCIASPLAGSAMDTIDLSLKLRRLAAWLDGRCQPDSLIRKQFHGSPFGGCYVSIDPDRQGPFPSANLNPPYLSRTEPALDFHSVPHL